MKNRERQRANRRMKQEYLSIRNSVGILDPTPYQAVKHMVDLEKINAKSSDKKEVA